MKAEWQLSNNFVSNTSKSLPYDAVGGCNENVYEACRAVTLATSTCRHLLVKVGTEERVGACILPEELECLHCNWQRRLQLTV